MKITKTTLANLENLLSEKNYRIRYEKGNFRGGHCVVENQRLVIVNKFYTLEGKVNTLLDCIVALGFHLLPPEELQGPISDSENPENWHPAVRNLLTSRIKVV
jgi:hypothetical protein